MSEPVSAQDLAIVLLRSDADGHRELAEVAEATDDPLGLADAHRLAAEWLEALADAMAAR